MTRHGFNPLRRQPLDKRLPDRIASVIVHLPHREGYHAERERIVKVCLLTLRQHLCRGVDVWVWDNGSFPEFREWLAEEYKPDALYLSDNIGKANARDNMLYMAGRKAIISMSDDDMIYHPGWWEACEKVLTTFPNVGIVSGYPVRTCVRWANSSALKWGKENSAAKVGRFVPEEYEREFARSIGRPFDQHDAGSRLDQDVLLTWNGVTAYVQGHHAQWMGYRDRLLPLSRRSGQYASDERLNFDEPINAAGWLRLSTTTRYVQHAGNAWDEVIEKYARLYGIEV